MRFRKYWLLVAAILFLVILIRIPFRYSNAMNVKQTRIIKQSLTNNSISSTDFAKTKTVSSNSTAPLAEKHPLIPKTSTVNRVKRRLHADFGGRFGNCLFQFAGVYGLSLSTNSESGVYFEDNGQANRLKKMFPKLNEILHIVSKISKDLKDVIEDAPNKFTHRLEEEIVSIQTDVRVRGYLGVFGYWWPKHEKQLRNVLQISEELQNQAKKYLIEIVSKNIPRDLLNARKNSFKAGPAQDTIKDSLTLVGIQVRRGDKVYSAVRDGWVLPEATYFEHAMDYFQKKYKYVYFIVVSDSKSWAKRNIIRYNVIHSNSKDDLLELTLLSLCDHTILSVGTFSWWAAWLAGGEAVYYPHHVRPNTMAGSFFNDSHYFLPHWISIE